jgi:DNA-binding LacI/PurR family transcriptional regulator
VVVVVPGEHADGPPVQEHLGPVTAGPVTSTAAWYSVSPYT